MPTPIRKGPCSGCPFNCTEESETIQNYGCLPGPFEIREAKDLRDREWLCHADETKVCGGLAQERVCTGDNTVSPSEWYHGKQEL